MLKIYHNNMCSKSRQTLQLIRDSGQEVEVVEYLKNAPGVEELKQVLQKLQLKPEQLLRKEEKLYKEEFAGKQFSDDEWIRIMSENPVLIERPIVVKDDKAVLGRPPEAVNALL